MPGIYRGVREATVRTAVAADVDAVVELMAAFYAEDGMPFSREPARGAVARLICDETLGRVWVAQSGDVLVGYIALTLGFSLEFMGRDAFVDDLFVRVAHRGQGIGARLLEALTDACQEFQIQAVHLEVDRAKTHTRELYRRFGFIDHDRVLMTLRIGHEPG
jgi:GNAT superfamily N-acetyltransferase